MFAKALFYLNTSIVKKQLMAVTGLLLCGFLVSHFLGNLLIYVGPDAFNIYAHKLTSNPLIYVAEAILATIFLTHMGLAAGLTFKNQSARGDQNYYMFQRTGRGATTASRLMVPTGIITFVFLIFHILHLKFGPYYLTTVDGESIRDLYKTVVEYFSSPYPVFLYVIGMFSLGLHLKHGFWSAFQSIGFQHSKYNNFIENLAVAFGVFVAVGFSSFPLYVYFVLGGQA